MSLAEPLSNLTNTAQMYSQVAGVLAGFAFTVLLGYLRRGPRAVKGRTPSRHGTESAVAVVLFSALGALIICAILYGILAGGQQASGNSYSGVMIVGPAFGLAIIAMFYATGLAAAPYQHLRAMLVVVRVLVGVIAPVTVMLLMAAAALDIHTYHCSGGNAANVLHDCHESGQLAPNQPFGLGLIYCLVLLAMTLVLIGVFRRPASSLPAWIPILVSALVLGTAVAGVIGMTMLDFMPQDFTLAGADIRAILSTIFVVLAVTSTLTIRTCHPSSKSVLEGKDQGRPHTTAAVGSDVGSPNGRTRPDVPQRILEQLDRPVLVRRSIEIFPQGYLMNISIIQGVALSVVVVEGVKYLKPLTAHAMIPGIFETALSLVGLITVSYEYLWFTTIMRWTPTFRDTAVPVVLGVGEIVPPLMLGNTSRWWLSITVFALLGAAAFLNTVTRLDSGMFPGHRRSFLAIRRLLVRLAVISLASSAMCVGVAAFSAAHYRDAVPASVAGSLLIIFAAVVIIGYSERVLNDVYVDYGVSRRPPFFEWLRPPLDPSRHSISVPPQRERPELGDLVDPHAPDADGGMAS